MDRQKFNFNENGLDMYQYRWNVIYKNINFSGNKNIGFDLESITRTFKIEQEIRGPLIVTCSCDVQNGPWTI